MRTVIFISGLSIADAIRENWADPKLGVFLGCVLVCAISMDVIEFINKLYK
jgi:hypothetical protein